MTAGPLRVALFGASGRMGRAIIDLIAQDPGFVLAAATTSPSRANAPRDVGDLIDRPGLNAPLFREPAAALPGVDVAIDVSVPAAAVGHLDACVASGTPLVIGVTGHDQAAQDCIGRAASLIAVLVAPNMSLGVNVLLELAERAARALDLEFDAEVFEAHHRYKRDAPSGTALAIGEAVARGRNSCLAESAVYARQGMTGDRPAGSIGFAVSRGGDIVGEHVLTFAGPGERLELAHRASDRATFARGGLRAARWLVGRAPGRYSMRDVLGL